MMNARVSDDYRRIETAIRYLQEGYLRQPRLEEVAKVAGLSPWHFQRVFTRWAGVSPKQLVAYLTVEHARTLLRGRETVLGAAYDAGLSGPGRLHDHFVTIEAVTPGEVRAAGAGLTIRHGFAESPFGDCFLAVTERGVVALQFRPARERRAALAELAEAWPSARLVADEAAVRGVARSAFRGDPRPPLRVFLKGTNLQVKVWEALLRVPEGSAVSYSDLAEASGHSRAVRAVASAVARNPVAYLIPCHRVLRKEGEFGQYRWGRERKVALLAWESARTAAAS